MNSVRPPTGNEGAAPSTPQSAQDGGPQFTIQLAAFSDPAFKVHRIIDAITFRPLSVSRLHSNEQSQSFDVRPFAKLFTSTLDDLVRLRKRVQREINDLEDQLAAQETSSKSKLADLGKSFSRVYSTFDTLESRVSEVGTTAVRIGEQLETIDKQRTKAADVRELLVFFLDLNKGVSERFDALCATPAGQLRAAVLARRLQLMVRDMDGSPQTETARTTIDRYCEQFESNLLKSFDKASEIRDSTTMRHVSQVLTEYNGGESAVRAWINRHPIFTTASGAKGDRQRDLPGDPGLRRLLEQLRATVYQDWELVSQVFSQPIPVMSQLVQRYFQQVVQPHLEAMLREASQVSDPQYLKTLANADLAVKALIKDMSHFDTTVLERSGAISRVVEQAVDEQFAVYRSTMDRELSHLSNLVQSVLKDALAYYGNRKQQKKSMFARIQKGSGPSTLEHHLSMDHLMEILAAHCASIERCLQLHSDPAASVAKLHLAICHQVYVKYIELALDAVWEETSAMDGSKAEPDFKMLVSVQSANTLVQLMQAHFETRAVPVLASSPTVHRSVVDEKNELVSRIEARASAICSHLLVCTIAHVQMLLGRQKKTDFRSRGDDAVDVAHQLSSPACVAICEFLSKVHGNLQSYMDGANFRVFALELGVQVHVMLLEHFKNDVAKYQQSIAAFQVPELVNRFDLLRELGHLFLVRPENLPSILSEGLLAQLDNVTLQAYLSNRADYKSARIEEMLQDRGRAGIGLSSGKDGVREGSSVLTLNSGVYSDVSASVSSLR
ncbi:exocyst complex component Sec10-domain-containing protein [Catenaria anguillulae PL171]|uniref:Exocyst complex component Sec10-domain-containing protein n=1 Tax=Catenaria anguillulae PL171 TaxID=765915 RepID=A0A1Y2HPJ9_9FUNG|nr:exocyst complex component Sec10-domain-containing protein [Catenaria anguillulae PL171]